MQAELRAQSLVSRSLVDEAQEIGLVVVDWTDRLDPESFHAEPVQMFRMMGVLVFPLPLNVTLSSSREA